MAKASKVKQLSFSMPDRVGLLSEVTLALARAKVNINALCAYEVESTACFSLSADSAAKAKKALAPLGVEILEEEVVGVEMPNQPGELQKVAKRLAEAGINIEYVYGTAGAGKSSICVFKTSDDKKTLKLINK